MTKIYFIKTEYTGNIYKVSDFYNSNGTFFKSENRSMAVDMRFNDGPTILDTQIKTLPDGSDLHDYTHIIVPDKQKVYTITAIDELNADSYKLYLEDEPLIANYQDFKNEDLIITRTTDYKSNWFQGVTDITDMSYDFTYETTDILPEQNGSGSDIWAAVYIQAPDAELYGNIISVQYNLSWTPGRLQAETFNNITALRNKYEDFTDYSSVETTALNKFFSLDYKYKIAYVKNTNKYYYLAIYKTEEPIRYHIEWKELKNEGYWALNKEFLTRTVNNNPDLSTVIMLIPNYEGIALKANVGTTTSEFVPSMTRFSGLTYTLNDSTKVAANILGVRLIPESLLKTEGVIEITSKGLDVSGLDSFTSISTPTNDKIYSGLTLNSLKEEIDVSLKGIEDSISNKEPFKTYELWIFGQKYDIPAYFVNDLHMVLSSTSDGIQYNIYRDVERRKLYISGTTSWDMKWKVDQLELYAMNNPTYKDEFNSKIQQKWVQTLVGGTVGLAGAGAMKGPAGLAAGAVGVAAAAVGTSISNKFDAKQFELMQANKRMSPDHILGDASGAAMVTKIHNGIYWLIKTHNNDAQMTLQYNRIGYPTYMKRSIMDITPIWNSLVEANARVLTGYFVDTIKNNYVTNEINKKISEGVILVI